MNFVAGQEDEKRNSMFKMLYINNYYGMASSDNVIVMGNRMSSALDCIETVDGICPT